MSVFTFFWKNLSPFANWYPSKFTWNNVQFTRAEQYLMYRKAMLFGDTAIANMILCTDDPSVQQQMGREVLCYDDAVWAQHRYDIMVEGLYCKFSQNPTLSEKLLATAGTTIAEASPDDCIWGIGLAEDDPDAQDETKWRGQNLLGKALMSVRARIIAEQTAANAE